MEDRLARLAGAVGPLRRVLSAIAERVIATEAYARLCYARLGDYARERAGVSGRQLQELARVHRVLAERRALERALLANELPWSKVRLLARVVTEANEEDWIARARAVNVRGLEQEVREAQRSEAAHPADEEEAEPQRRVSVRCTLATRERWALVREIAERQAGGRLRESDVLELVVAEAFSAVSIAPALAEMLDEPAPRPRAGGRAEGEAGRTSEAPPEPRAGARALPDAVVSLAEGLDDADAFELDRRLRQAVQLEQTLDAAIAPLLRVVTCAEYEWRRHYQTLSRYAPEQIGMSASKARALLRLERGGDACPELREAYRSGRLSWVKAQCLLPLFLLDLDGDWRPIWIDWAQRVTVRRLEADVERALLLRAGSHFAWQRCKFDPERAQDPVPPEERQMCAPDVDTEATQQLEWRVPHDVALLFYAVRGTLRAKLDRERGRLVTGSEVLDGLFDLALEGWTVRDPRARRPDPVMERDRYRCAVPGCTSRRNLHDHHIIFRSDRGSNVLHNRITLCAFHHERALHRQHILKIRGAAPHGLVFELGLRSEGPPLARYRSGDVALGAGAGAGLRDARDARAGMAA